MLLRGMHDHGCVAIYIIVTDIMRQQMDDVTEYFKLVCRNAFGRTVKPSMERRIQYERAQHPLPIIRAHERSYPVPDMRLTHTFHRQRRTPCFPQIDLTLRAILYEKRPPFVILFSHQTTSYSQILFTHPMFVPASEVFFDFPSGCPNPCCSEDCEMIRFPRRGVESAAVLAVKRGGKWGKIFKAREMCNWIDCDVCFSEEPLHTADGTSEGSHGSVEGSSESTKAPGQTCSKCKMVKYCSPEHQKNDWE